MNGPQPNVSARSDRYIRSDPFSWTMDCPECSKPMERGFLAAESFIGGAKWTTKKTKLGVGGEALVKPDGLGNVYLEGFHCPSCKLLSLRY